MRPWMVALLSATGTLLFIILWTSSRLTGFSPPSWPIVVKHLPALATAGLVLYACLALLLTTVLVIVDLGRIRLRMSKVTPLTREACGEIFSGSRLAGLAQNVLSLTVAEATSFGKKPASQSRFGPGKARRRIIARLYHSALSRSQFFTACVVLLTVAALGSLHGYAQISIILIDIPIRLIVGAIMALATLWAFSWFVVSATAAPLLDRIAQLPRERQATVSIPAAQTTAEPMLEFPRTGSHPEGNSVCEDAVPSPAPAETLIETVTALKTAVEELTATIKGLPSALQQMSAAEPPRVSAKGSQRQPVLPNNELGRELRGLLKEFD